jgi:uncharacterized protein
MDFYTLFPTFAPEEVWRFLLLGSLSALIFGMGKVGFGGGVGMLSIPIMIAATGGRTMTSTGLMLPLLIAADYVGVVSWWRQWAGRSVVRLIPTVVVGVAAGTGVLWWFQRLNVQAGHQAVAAKHAPGSAALMLGIGAITLGFVLLKVVQILRGRSLAFRPVWWQTAGAGAAVGLTSTLAHAAGPVATMYFISQPDMPKKRFVASMVLLFWVGNQLKVPAYIALGMINAESLLTGLWLIPATVIGALLGRWLVGRVNERVFQTILYTLLAATAIHLSVRALTQLLG